MHLGFDNFYFYKGLYYYTRNEAQTFSLIQFHLRPNIIQSQTAMSSYYILWTVDL